MKEDPLDAIAAQLVDDLGATPQKHPTRTRPSKLKLKRPSEPVDDEALDKVAEDLTNLFLVPKTTKGEQFIAGFGQGVAQLAKAPEFTLKALDKAAVELGIKPETLRRHGPFMRAAQSIAEPMAEFGRKLEQGAEALEGPYPNQDFTSQLSRGAGSLVPFAGLGLASRGAVAAGGAAMTAIPMFEDILAETGDETKAWAGAALGVGIGASEAVGVGRVLSKLDRAAAGSLRKALAHVASEASEEALQEWFQSFSEATSRQALTDKEVTLLENAVQSGTGAAVGAILGGAVSTILEAPGILPGRKQKEPLGFYDTVRQEKPAGRTVADIGYETAPSEVAKKRAARAKKEEPRAPEEAAQALLGGETLEAEEFTPEVIQKAVELRDLSFEGTAAADMLKRRYEERSAKNKQITPGPVELTPGAEAKAEAAPEEATQESAGVAQAPGVSFSEEKVREHALRSRGAAFRTPGFISIERDAMKKGLTREEVRALSKEMDSRALDAIQEADIPSLKEKAAAIIAKGEAPVSEDELASARLQLELRNKPGLFEPQSRLNDAVEALRYLVEQHEAAPMAEEDIVGAVQRAERVLHHRGQRGAAATEIDAALENLLHASKLQPEYDVEGDERTGREKAKTGYTLAAINSARKILDVFDAAKRQAAKAREEEARAPAKKELQERAASIPGGVFGEREAQPEAPQEPAKVVAPEAVPEPAPPVEPQPSEEPRLLTNEEVAARKLEEAKAQDELIARGERMTGPAALDAADVPGLPIKVNPNDVDIKLANRAHEGLSWTPGRRGYLHQQDYIQTMRSAWSAVEKYVRTPEQRAAAAAELERFKAGYLKHLASWLHAQGRVVSVNVAGPSKFPARRMEKLGNWSSKRLNELIEYTKKAQAAMVRAAHEAAKAQTIEEAGGEVALEKQRLAASEKFQETMKAANAIVRKKGLTDEQKIEQISALGVSVDTARKILTPPYSGAKAGFEAWQLQSNLAKINRHKERIAQLESKEVRAGRSVQFEGGTVELDEKDDRIRILFDKKPAADMLRQLRSNGFKWAPSVKAWQRQWTDNGELATERLLGIKLAGESAQVSEARGVELAKEAQPETTQPTAEEQGFRVGGFYGSAKAAEEAQPMAEDAPEFQASQEVAIGRFFPESEYVAAQKHAQNMADTTGLAVRLKAVTEFGKKGYSVRFVPRESKQFGRDIEGEAFAPRGSVLGSEVPTMPPGLRYFGTIRMQGANSSGPYVLGIAKDGHVHDVRNGRDMGAFPIPGANILERLKRLAHDERPLGQTFEPAPEFAQRYVDIKKGVEAERARDEEHKAAESARVHSENQARASAEAKLRERFRDAGRKWKKGKITFKDAGGNETTLGALLSPSGMFAVRKDPGDGWIVSHVPSGLSFGAGFASQQDAKAVAARSEAVPEINWKGKTIGEVFPSKEIGQRAYNIIRAARTYGHGFAPTEAEIETEKSVQKSVQGPPAELMAFPGAITSELVEAGRKVVDKIAKKLGYIRSQKAMAAGTIPTEDFLEKQIRNWQDSWRGVRQAQVAVLDAGGEIQDDTDTYLKEELRRGKTKARLVAWDNTHAEPLLEHLRKSGISPEEFGEALMARHAPERNAAILERDPDNPAGSGMTDAEAAAIMMRVEGGKRAEAFMAGFAAFDVMMRDVRAGWVRDGLMSKREVDELEGRYRFYAPLRSDLSEEDSAFAGTGRGIDVRGPEFKTALGRHTRANAREVLAYALTQAQSAIVRGEKNRVGQAFLNFLRANPEQTKGLAKISPKQIKKALRDGMLKTVYDPLFRQRDNVILVQEGGDHFWIEIDEKHQNIADAFKNLGAEDVGSIIRLAGGFTRTLAALSTRYNPVFPLFNAIRDTSGAFINSQEHGLAFATRTVRDAPIALAALSGKGNGRWLSYADEYRSVGAPVSFLDISNFEQQLKRIEADTKARSKTGSMAAAWRGGKAMLHAIESVVDAGENAVRLSAYVHAREELGMSAERAASWSKNLTTNFERRGDYGAAMNALYMFANAGIQSTARVAQALKHPAVRRLLIAAAFGLMGWDQLQRLIGGKDVDGEDHWDKIPEWEKRHNFIFMYPDGSGKRVTIPAPFTYDLIQTIAFQLSAAASGDAKPGAALAEMLSASLETFDPIGSGKTMLSDPASMARTAAPTVLDPLVELATNRDWKNDPIAPSDEFDKKPDAETFWPDVSPTAKAATQWLNRATGGDQFESGAVDLSPETLEHWAGFLSGGLGRTLAQTWDLSRKVEKEGFGAVRPRDVPLASRLLKEPSTRASASDFRDLHDAIGRERERAKLEKRGMPGELYGLWKSGNKLSEYKSKRKKEIEAITAEAREQAERELDRTIQTWNRKARLALLTTK